MMLKKDGGAAFPHPNPNYDGNWDKEPARCGMSLRDYFAAHADVPWEAAYETLSLRGNTSPTVREMAEYRASMRYIQADAMLAAREAQA